MQNFKLVLAYDGSRWKGWQRQGNTGATIQAKLEETLSRILEQPVECTGSGRTDAGVHARAQTVSFRADTSLPPEAILSHLRAYLPEDIGAVSLDYAPPRFHARLSCKGKTYCYRLWTSPLPCVFERKYVLRADEPLDRAAMERAAALLVGEHDFAAFSTGKAKRSTLRRLDRIELREVGNELCIFFSGNGFLYNMARILTGTLLEVGAGRMDPETIPTILESRDRALAGPTAPAKGLTLWETEY